MINILQEADKIIHRTQTGQLDRSSYGPMEDNIKDAAIFASILRNKHIEPLDVLACLAGIKLSREKFNHKEDNLLDFVAYIASYNEIVEQQLKK